MENELFALVENVKEMLNILNTKVTSIEDRTANIENVVFNQILTPIKERYDELEREDRFSTFNEKYSEQFAPYVDQTKAIEGDDFDLARKTFDDYDASDKSIPEEEYVNGVVDSVKNQLEKIKESLADKGVEAETVEATIDENGNVEIEAKDENGETVATEETVEETSDDADAEITDDENDEISDAEDLAAYEAELESEMDKQ